MDIQARLRKTQSGWQVEPLDPAAMSAAFNDGDDVTIATAVGSNDSIDPIAAKAQLDLVLSFFARVETKLSVVLAIDLGMLSLAFTKATPVAGIRLVPAIALAAFVTCQACAFLALYRGSFPSLNGGNASLVYFREVAKLRESEYKERFAALPKAGLARDHLEQAWRNARILTTKFDQLQKAYQWTALSIVPWIIALSFLAAGVAP